ncbi:DUF2946 family protein [Luteimonas sp. A649]
MTAVMLLLVLPTAGRMLQAPGAAASVIVSGHAGSDHVAPGAAHAHHGHHATQVAGDGERPVLPPGPVDGPDCDYCPLLASLVAVAQPGFVLPRGSTAWAVFPAYAAPRLPWFHPSGLGSRGPPLHG